MRLRIEARPVEGLRLIRDIPLHRLGRLEGYNGIGKSAALRLLQVCVGVQPYLPEEQALWHTFRTYLDRCTVTLEGLTGGSQLTWQLDPSTWPDEVTEPLTEVGSIDLDGVAVDLPRVRQLLRVDRVVGNEGLVPTLVRQLAPRRRGMDDRLGAGSFLDQRQQAVDDHFFGLLEVLQQITGAPLDRSGEQTSRSATALDAANRAAQHANSRLLALDRASELTAQLQRTIDQSADLEAQSRSMTAEIAGLEAVLQALDGEVAAAGGRASAAPAVRHELELSTRNADRTATASSEATARAGRTARRLGLEESPLDVDLAALRLSIEASRAAASASAASAFLAPRLIGAADRVLQALDGLDPDLEHEVILWGDGGRPDVTLRQLRIQVRATRSRLRLEQPPDTAVRFQHETEELDERLRLLDRLEAEIEEARRRHLLADRAQERLAAAGAALAEVSGADLADVLARREHSVSSIRDLAVARAEVIRAQQDLSGGLTVDELRAALDRALQDADATEDDLQRATREARALDAELAQNVRDATAALSAAKDEGARIRTRVQTALDRIGQEERFSWAKSVLPATPPGIPGDLQNLQELYRPLQARIEGARARLARTRALPIQAIGAIRQLEAQLAQGSPTTTAEERPILTAVRDWFSGEVSGWFNQPVLREVLFNDAAEVRIDLSDMSVSWTAGSDHIVRPLTAFSSGEQAFAYTRARLAILEREQDTRDHIIALDEFGAFIARNWLYRLEAYLLARSVQRPADRLLLVLPLTRTEDELQQSGAPAAELHRAATQGYFVSDLSGTPVP